MRHLSYAAMMTLLAAPLAHAQTDRTESDVASHVNLRIGSSTTDDNGRPSICLEVRVWRQLSIEGCGTGSGVLHKDAGGEMAHFRAKWTAWQKAMGVGHILVQPGIGFAELELGRDEAGFQFGDPTGTSAAGAEAALSVQYMAPLKRGLEFIASATSGGAYIRGADRLPTSPSRNQLFAAFELGIGW